MSNGNGSLPMVDLDIMAHEYAHAINAKGANVVCNNEPIENGALVESFCDIMGIMVQSTIKQLDWNIGESVGTLRALNTPKLYSNPTTYGGQYWNAATTASDGLRYANSHVLSYWFYMLATGYTGTVDDGFSASYPSSTPSRNVPSGTTFNVPAISAEKVAKILLEVFTTIITDLDSWGLNDIDNQNYPGIARATLTVAGQLYGACSAEALAVREAWRAVGIDNWQAEWATCDITKPYIKELKVTNSSGAIKYHKHWQINPVNGKLCLTDVAAAPQSLIVGAGQTFQLEVTSSEPLSDFSFLGFKPSGAGLISTGFTSAVTTSNPTIWTATITIDASLVLAGEVVAFVFSGHDMAGNELLSMHNMVTGTPPCLNYNDLPQRFSPTAPWMPTTAPQGTDEIHKMNLYACSPDLPDTDICDNHLPYIQSVQIVNPATSETLAHQSWQYDGPAGQYCLEMLSAPQSTDLSDGITLQVTASEPLQTLSFDGLFYNGNLLAADDYFSVTTNADTDQTEYTCSVQLLTDAPFLIPDVYALVFSGTDLAGNSLENLTDYPSFNPVTVCFDAADIPQKTETGNWQPPESPDSDRLHTLNINLCQDQEGFRSSVTDCFTVSFEIQMPCGAPVSAALCTNTDITVVNQSSEPIDGDLTYSWNFGEGASLSPLTDISLQEYTVQWTSPGTKTITLTVWNNVLGYEVSYFQTITVNSSSECIGSMSISEIAQNCNQNTGVATITWEMTNGTAPFTYSVLAGPLQTTNNTFIEAQFTEPLPGGYYDIFVTDANGCQQSIGGTIWCFDSNGFNYTLLEMSCSPLDDGEWALNIIIGYEGTATFVGLAGEDNSIPFQQIQFPPNPVVLYAILPDNSYEATFIISDNSGANWQQSVTCDFIVSTNTPSNTNFLAPNLVSVPFIQDCSDAEQICIPYTFEDSDDLIMVKAESETLHFDYHNIYSHGPIASGTFCFTPLQSDIGVHDVVLTAYDNQPERNKSVHHLTLSVLCCPTGFGYPQELQAVYDCNGNLYQPAEATVTALTGGCNLNFTLNGSTNHTLSHLGEGVYDLTLSFNNQTYQFENAITVAGIYLVDDNLEITHTAQPSLAACSSDQCNGQISLSVSGGSGNYSYQWSDCFPDPEEMMPCNIPLRNNLCAGTYTVTITDDMTGCETVYTANVSLYYPANAGVLSDNEFSVSPTVFSGSTTLTYRVGYDAQVSISMFNGQGILVDSPIQQEFRAEGQYNMTHSPPAGLPKGIYFYVLYVCEEPLTRVAVKVY